MTATHSGSDAPGPLGVHSSAQEEAAVQDAITLAIAHLRKNPPEEELAREVMFRAEGAATRVRHLGYIARCWATEFRDIEETRRCWREVVDRAVRKSSIQTVDGVTKGVDGDVNLVFHAIAYRHVPVEVYLPALLSSLVHSERDPEPSLGLMQDAEEAAEAVRSSLWFLDGLDEEDIEGHDKAECQRALLYVARCWLTDWGNREEAVRCVRRAEELAAEMQTVWGWVEVAKFWSIVMRQPDKSRPFLVRAESAEGVATLYASVQLAEAAAALGDTELMVQYLDRAEKNIEELSDWQSIRYHWEDFGHLDRADRAYRIWQYMASRVSAKDYLENGGHGRYAAEDGPY